MLRRALEDGESVRTHDADFEDDLDDEVWLEQVGRRGWVVLSKDQAITRNPLELRALLAASVAFFGVSAAHCTGAELGLALVRALPIMRTCLRRFRRPFIASVRRDGSVSVRWESGRRMPEAKEFRAPRVREK
jgi:hypothetical protein